MRTTTLNVARSGCLMLDTWTPFLMYRDKRVLVKSLSSEQLSICTLSGACDRQRVLACIVLVQILEVELPSHEMHLMHSFIRILASEIVTSSQKSPFMSAAPSKTCSARMHHITTEICQMSEGRHQEDCHTAAVFRISRIEYCRPSAASTAPRTANATLNY